MDKMLPIIKEIQKELNALNETKTLAQAQRVILSVIRLLDSSISLDDSKQFQLFNVDNQKISANAQWFYEDNVVVDRRAIYKIHSENKLNVDFKLYGIVKPSKRTISWVQALTPNFEDEPFNSKFNIGIDFVVPKSADKVIIVLSNNYVVRTLELKGMLTATFQEILAKWASISDFSNKKEAHSILWESFDLQPLNKKFYAGISERFITLRQYLTKEDILDEKHASLFANRLLGRVIFCWFLDKKGVINPDRKYFDSHSFGDDSEYYRKNLENLFFGVLNTPIADREYKDEVTPFLNGGLFEARDTDLYRNPKLTFPKNYFDDLFDFLSSYNFTTDESTSQFQQVAIDPEMLGRIFENLLAEMTEETGEQARKAKGAFYTPREIVDYMCRESLREYLKTKMPEDQFRDQRLTQLIDAPDKDFQDQDHNWRRDWRPYKDTIIKALDELKVLDPACGSGAFPIGMLQLLARIYERLEPRFDTYKAKLQIVEKNIYGIDIEPMAVEIARLRAWLSIIVDEETDSKKIKPLPNLEFKFICANSLIDLDRNGTIKFGDDPELANKLQSIRDAYFNTESVAKKKRLRIDYEQLVNQSEGLFGESTKSKQLKTYRPFDNERTASFFSPEFMFGVTKFDLIIGNPPYVSAVNSRSNGSLRDQYRANYPQLSGAFDLYAAFILRGLNLLVGNGVYAWIVPNKIMVSKYSEGTLKALKEYGSLSIYNVSKIGVFENTGVYPIMMIGVSGECEENYYYVDSIRALKNKQFRKKDIRKEYKSNFGDFLKIASGTTGFQAQSIIPYITEEKSAGSIPFVVSGCIDPWKVEYSNVRYMGKTYIKAFIVNNDKISSSKWDLWKQDKIIISGMTKRIEAVYATEPTAIGVGVYAIYGFGAYSPYFILGILNSTFMTHFLKENFDEKHLSGGYLAINKSTIERLPLPRLDTVRNQALGEEIEGIAKKLNQGDLNNDYIGKLNKLVMDIYELSEEERADILDRE